MKPNNKKTSNNKIFISGLNGVNLTNLVKGKSRPIKPLPKIKRTGKPKF